MKAAVVGLLALALSAGWATGSEAAGPWRGQVVDAETGQPLADVVVLAVWEKRSPGIIHDRVEFHDAAEVVTDVEGRFAIPERSVKTLNPFVEIAGPRIVMFKGGFGQWRYREAREWKTLDSAERADRVADALRRFAQDGIVFELPPLKTRKERLDFARPSYLIGRTPASRIPRYFEAVNAERVLLGLDPERR